MRATLRILAVLIATALVVGPAAATVRVDPVKIRPAGPLPRLQPGQSGTVELELVTARPVTVTGLEMTSASLAAPVAVAGSVAAGGALAVDPEAPILLTLQVVLDEDPEPLSVRYAVDGEVVERTIDLSLLLETAYRPTAALRTLPGSSADQPGGFVPPVYDRPFPTGEGDPEVTPLRSDGGQLRGGARDIRVRGRLVYFRSDGTVVGVDTMWGRVMNENWGPDGTLSQFLTNEQGYFDHTFEWYPPAFDDEPDIYLKFETETDQVTVQSAGLEVEYSWNSPTTWDFEGTMLDLGVVAPIDETFNGALHIHTCMIRNYRWYEEVQLYDLPGIHVQWPDGSTGAYYQPFWEEIHVSSERTWWESTMAHELGHHFINKFAAWTEPDYCNGTCDTPSCGHCIWCSETDHDAFSEGWPNWISYVQTSSYDQRYGVAAVFNRDQEYVARCSEGGLYWDDPLTTEGFIGAILQDVWDSEGAAQEQDPDGLGERDALALGSSEIFTVLDEDHPTTPIGFLDAFKARYPEHTVDLWRTALNCRLQLDQENPSPVTGLVSTTHVPNVPNTNGQIVLTWNPSTDDWSGVNGYQFTIDRPAPLPDTTFVLTASPIGATYWLPPGTYSILVRALDRAGRLGDAAAAGPYVIEAPVPADLAFITPWGWARPLVARPDGGAGQAWVPDPVTLAGNSASTWVNCAVWNAGQESYEYPPAASRFYLDGLSLGPEINISPGPGEIVALINRGPYTVRGGRHTLGFYADHRNYWFESNEYNNTWARPFVWSPLLVAEETTVRRAAPPDATAGWSWVRDGSPLHYNCDGLRFTGSGWWNAFWLAADADTVDYDCRLYDASTGPTSGFAVDRGVSLRGEGCLDLVVVNANTVGFANWDVGVTRSAGSAAPWVAGHAVSGDFAYGDSLTVAFPDSQYVLLSEVYVSVETYGLGTVTATGDPEDGPFMLAFLDRDLTTAGLTGAIFPVVSDETGRARLNFNGTIGYHCVLLFRDPKHGRSARSLVLEIERALPDLAPYQSASWHSPLVPRPAADGTPSSVPLPDTLYGDLHSTYLNFQGRNESGAHLPAGTPFHLVRDGSPIQTATVPYLGPLGYHRENQTVPVTVPGGRHTLALVYDPTETLEELIETNNIWGEQYVWGPAALVPGLPAVRPTPPDRTGGWMHIRSGEPVLFNSDGVRVPVLSEGSAEWAAIAMLPDVGADVDLRLHETGSGVKDGFSETLGTSAWGPGELEYILLDFAHTPRRELDAGLVSGDGGAGSLTVEAGSAQRHTVALPATLGPFSLDGGAILALHEVVIEPGTYSIRLLPESGNSVDLGIAVHARDGVAIHSRASALAASWFAAPEEEETIELVVETAGPFAIPVWRVSASDLALSGQYRIEIETSTSAVPADPIPTVTALIAPYPSPFRSSATIAFHLAEPEAVRLEIYSAGGIRVRTLADGIWEAGRHTVAWDGQDAAERPVPAGVYFVRLVAGSHRQGAKLVKTQ